MGRKISLAAKIAGLLVCGSGLWCMAAMALDGAAVSRMIGLVFGLGGGVLLFAVGRIVEDFTGRPG